MTYKEIQDIIKLVGKSDLAEFRMKEGDFSLTIRTRYYQKGVSAVPHQLMSSVPMAPAYPAAPPPASTPAAAAAGTPAASPGPAKDDESKYIAIKSPMVGTFYRSASPDKPPYAKVGDVIETGSVVCVVEAMKLFNEIESEVRGKIVKVAIEDAQPVEYDQVLFLVDPKG